MNPYFRRNLFESLKDSKHSKRTITLEDFKLKLEDVWNAVKSESFVFNFKNSLSMKIYNEMQNHFDKEWNQLRTMIWNNVSDSSKAILSDGRIEDVETARAKLRSLMQREKIKQEESRIMEELEKLAKDSANSDFGMKSIPDFKIALQRNIENSQNKDIDKVLSQFKSNKQKLDNQNKLEKFKAKILKEAQEIVDQFLQRGDDVPVEVKERRFNELFREWEKSANKEDENLKDRLERELYNIRIQYSESFFEKLDRIGFNREEMVRKIEEDKNAFLRFPGFGFNREEMARKIEEDKKNNLLRYPVDLKANWTRTNLFKWNKICEQDRQIARNLIQKLVNEINEKMKSALRKGGNFLFESVLEEILTSLKTEIGDGINFTNDYQEKIIAYFYNSALSYLEESHSLKKKTLSFQSYLRENRNDLKQNFLDDCDKVENEARFADLLFRNVVKGKVVERQIEKLGVKVFEELTKRDIFVSKSDMLFNIHKELLSKTADDVYQFCSGYRPYIERWMEENVRRELMENDYLETTWTERTNNCLQDILESIQSNDRNTSSLEWLNNFQRKMSMSPVIFWNISYFFLFLFCSMRILKILKLIVK